jgi:hypothetical protein
MARHDSRPTILVILALLGSGVAACSGGAVTDHGPSAPNNNCRGSYVSTQAEYDNAVFQFAQVCPARGTPEFPRFRSSRNGDVQGSMCTQIGSGFEAGQCGFSRDVAAARRFYDTACAIGWPPGCNALARLGGTPQVLPERPHPNPSP